MRKKQIEKVREEFERMDLSRWHILTYDELLKVNGGSGSDSDDSDDETVGSYWQSAYNTLSHVISVTAGAKVGGFVFTAGTASRFGIGAVPSAVGGAVAGYATSKIVDYGFDWLEEQIWEEAK